MAAKRGHTPIRMCAVCRERREKSALMRFVRAAGPDGPIADPGQKKPGRGVYVCPATACMERFGKSRRKRKGV